jgi:hypothetical protein
VLERLCEGRDRKGRHKQPAKVHSAIERTQGSALEA